MVSLEEEQRALGVGRSGPAIPSISDHRSCCAGVSSLVGEHLRRITLGYRAPLGFGRLRPPRGHILAPAAAAGRVGLCGAQQRSVEPSVPTGTLCHTKGCGVGPGGFDVQNAGGTLFTRPIQRLPV